MINWRKSRDSSNGFRSQLSCKANKRQLCDEPNLLAISTSSLDKQMIPGNRPNVLFNKVIWKKCPSHLFAKGKSLICIAPYLLKRNDVVGRVDTTFPQKNDRHIAWLLNGPRIYCFEVIVVVVLIKDNKTISDECLFLYKVRQWVNKSVPVVRR